MAVQFLEQIQQVSARQKVHAAIRDAILTGKLKVGERITETELSESLNVSRAIIREALQQLTHEGLVEQNSYKGTRVVRLSPDQLDETIAVRLLLETEAVRLAKERLKPADKRALRSLVNKLENSRGNAGLYAELDLALHEKLWELSGNQTLKKMLMQVTVPLFAMGTIIRSARTFGEETLQTKDNRSDHYELIEKICDGTTDEAVAAMEKHLTQNSSYTRENFERFLAEPQKSTEKPIEKSREASSAKISQRRNTVQ